MTNCLFRNANAVAAVQWHISFNCCAFKQVLAFAKLLFMLYEFIYFFNIPVQLKLKEWMLQQAVEPDATISAQRWSE